MGSAFRQWQFGHLWKEETEFKKKRVSKQVLRKNVECVLKRILFALSPIKTSYKSKPKLWHFFPLCLSSKYFFFSFKNSNQLTFVKEKEPQISMLLILGFQVRYNIWSYFTAIHHMYHLLWMAESRSVQFKKTNQPLEGNIYALIIEFDTA